MALQYQIERYLGSDRLYHWRLRAPNGRIMCQGEGHPVKGGAKRAARRCGVVLATAPLIDVAETYTPAPTGRPPKLPRRG